MVDHILEVFGGLQELIQLGNVFVGLADVQGTEVLVKWFILEVLEFWKIYVIDIEVEGFTNIFRRLRIRDPIESI